MWLKVVSGAQSQADIFQLCDQFIQSPSLQEASMAYANMRCIGIPINRTNLDTFCQVISDEMLQSSDDARCMINKVRDGTEVYCRIALVLLLDSILNVVKEKTQISNLIIQRIQVSGCFLKDTECCDTFRDGFSRREQRNDASGY